MKKLFERMNFKKLKNGSYSILFTVAVIAVVVVINLIVGEIPSQYTKIDVSDQKLYTIGEQSKKLVKSLDTDITIYYIVQKNAEDPTIDKMLERYEDLSSHIKVVKKDPVLYPNFTSQYTQEEVPENSIIVVNGEKSKVLNYDVLYETEINYETYSSDVTGFDGEGQLTSALSYVTSDNMPIIYQLEGHGEEALTSSVTAAIEKENMDIQSLNLLTEESVPEDTATLIICAPASDLSEEEAQKVISYLENGGKALIFSNYTTEELPNFKSVMESYGVQTVDGVVLEGDSQHYIQAPFYLVPTINDTEITADMIADNRYVLVPAAQGIKKLDNYRDTLTIESILSTTDSAYSKVDVENMDQYEKEDGDIDGPFDLGVAISETSGTNETQMVYFSSSALLDESTDEAVSGGNVELVMSALSWMSKGEGTSIAVPSKSLELTYLTLTDFDVSVWTLVSLILIPALFLICGFTIWFRRRKR